MNNFCNDCSNDQGNNERLPLKKKNRDFRIPAVPRTTLQRAQNRVRFFHVVIIDAVCHEYLAWQKGDGSVVIFCDSVKHHGAGCIHDLCSRAERPPWKFGVFQGVNHFIPKRAVLWAGHEAVGEALNVSAVNKQGIGSDIFKVGLDGPKWHDVHVSVNAAHVSKVKVADGVSALDVVREALVCLKKVGVIFLDVCEVVFVCGEVDLPTWVKFFPGLDNAVPFFWNRVVFPREVDDFWDQNFFSH